MSKVARKLDQCSGICKHPSHRNPIPMTGFIKTSQSTVYCDGRPVAVDGDIVIGQCGHQGFIRATSGKTRIKGKKCARVGDSFNGDFSGSIVSGSLKTDSQ